MENHPWTDTKCIFNGNDLNQQRQFSRVFTGEYVKDSCWIRPEEIRRYSRQHKQRLKKFEYITVTVYQWTLDTNCYMLHWPFTDLDVVFFRLPRLDLTPDIENNMLLEYLVLMVFLISILSRPKGRETQVIYRRSAIALRLGYLDCGRFPVHIHSRNVILPAEIQRDII